MRSGGSIKGWIGALAAGVALFVAASAQAGLTLTPAYTASLTAPVNSPIYVTAPPGDTSRLFVVERGGRIRVAVDGVMRDTPFLDISSRVQTTGEGGLLSMAFPSDYGTSGKFYVYFVQKSDGDIRIEQFTRSAADPNVADTATPPTLMLDIPHPGFTNHYGGQLQWGPGNKLYAGTGDGGGGDDTNNNSQNASSMLGKLLAIDPASPGTASIAALGLRNPFRFSFDRATNDLVIGDVGQDDFEEVDFIPAPTLSGLNFGWPCREGAALNDGRSCTVSPYVDPVLAPTHINGWKAITGGVVVRDPALTSLVGRYLYADFYVGQIRSAQLATPVSDDRIESTLPPVSQLVAFGEDAGGRVYVVSLAGGSTGVRRIVCDGSCEAPTGGSTGGSPPAQQPPTELGPGTGPSGPGPALPAVAKDTTPPLLRIRAAHLQRVLSRGLTRLSVACDEACLVRVSGKARGLALRGVLKRLEAGARTEFDLPIPQRVRRALARRGTIRLSVRGRDAAANLRTASLTIRVKRG